LLRRKAPRQKHVARGVKRNVAAQQLALQAQMDIPDIEVCELNGESLSLRKNLKKAVEALDKDGCLLLKKATDLTTVESALSSDINSPDAIIKHVVLNEVSLLGRFLPV
jgi:hypothetical protein